MSKAFKCDLTGKVEDGNGIEKIVVPISNAVRLTIIPHVSSDKGRSFYNGAVCQEAADRVIKALQAEFGAPQQPSPDDTVKKR